MREKLAAGLAIAIIAAAIIVPTYVFATFSLATTGSVTVTTTPAPTQAQIITASVAGVSCTIAANGLSASCPSSSLAVSGQSTISVTVSNTGTTPISPLVNALTSDGAVATISQNFGNPTSIAAGGTATFLFTINAVGVGATGYSVAISG